MRTSPACPRTCQTFVAAKTTCPIVHPGGLAHDSLIQLSLDPTVLAISLLGQEGTPPPELVSDIITVACRDGRYWLDIVECRATRPLRELDRFEGEMNRRGLAPLTLAGRDIMSEPRFSSARAVWSHRRFQVGIEMRLAIMHVLSEVSDMPLAELCAAVPGPQSPVPAVMSLACANAVELELGRSALGPDTRVRWRD